MPACGCGCGTQTKGGTYAVGHDAKHKSALIHLALGGDQVATDTLAAKGWTKFLDRKRDILAKTPTQVKQERTEKVAVDLEENWRHYCDMKAALAKLRAIDRAKGENKLVITHTNVKAVLLASESELQEWTQDQLDAEAA